MKKYPLKENSHDMKVHSDESDFLFAFGAEDEDDSMYLKDIVVYKKDSANKRSVDAYGKAVELGVSTYLLDTGYYPTNLDTLQKQILQLMCTSTEY